MLTFYDFSKAPSPRRVRIVLAEKNIPHDVIEIDMMKGEQMSAEYRKINPQCTIPALKLEDGTVLTSVAGITAYLEATYPDNNLSGTTPMEKADIAGWTSRAEFELANAIPNALRNTNPAFKDRALPGPDNYAQIPELGARGMKMIDLFMDKLDTHLDGRDYIAADRFSLADITVVSFLDFARVVGKKITDAHPNVARWRALLAERASINL